MPIPAVVAGALISAAGAAAQTGIQAGMAKGNSKRALIHVS